MRILGDSTRLDYFPVDTFRRTRRAVASDGVRRGCREAPLAAVSSPRRPSCRSFIRGDKRRVRSDREHRSFSDTSPSMPTSTRAGCPTPSPTCLDLCASECIPLVTDGMSRPIAETVAQVPDHSGAAMRIATDAATCARHVPARPPANSTPARPAPRSPRSSKPRSPLTPLDHGSREKNLGIYKVIDKANIRKKERCVQSTWRMRRFRRKKKRGGGEEGEGSESVGEEVESWDTGRGNTNW